MGAEIATALARIDLATALAAVALVILIYVVIKLGKILLMAAIFGAIVGAASWSQGHDSRTAATHAAIAFGAAAVMFFVVKMTKNILLWLTITAAGVGGLLLFGVHH